MKKALLIILLILPIVLVVVVAIAGFVAGNTAVHQSVEDVAFVDELFGNPYTDQHVFKIEQGKTASTKCVVYPSTATDKRVIYESSNENVCTIDENGVITAVHWGEATITAKTKDGGKTAVLHIRVTLDVPCAVVLTPDKLTMIEGEVSMLDVYVDAPVAVNKNVSFESSDLNVVTVDQNGKLKAHKAGTAIITVTTESGGLTDFCFVTVEEGVLPISFNFENVEHEYLNGFYVLPNKVVNLRDCLEVSDLVNKDDVIIELVSGNATLSDGVLSMNTNSIIVVRAYVGDREKPTYLSEISLIYR